MSALATLATEDKRLREEKLCFMEEQNIRRSLGPSLWQEFSDAIKNECGNFNAAASGRTLTATEEYLKISVRDSRSARTIRFSFNEAGPCIAILESGGRLANIVFRVDHSPEPSLKLVHNGTPWLPQDLAQDLLIGFASAAK